MIIAFTLPLTTYLIALVGIVLGILGAAMAYIISEAFKLPQLKGWAIQEITETLKTVIIVFFIILGLYLVNDLLAQAMGLPTAGTLNNPVQFILAKMYFRTMFAELASIYLYTVPPAILFSTISSHSITLMCFNFNLLGMTGLLAKAFTNLTNTVTMTLMLLAAQEVVLDFFKNTALTVFLPLGIVMRAFPILRKTGSTIIAFAIVAYFIYPAAVIFNEFVYFNYAFGNFEYDILDDGYESGQGSAGNVDYTEGQTQEMTELLEGNPDTGVDLSIISSDADATAADLEVINSDYEAHEESFLGKVGGLADDILKFFKKSVEVLRDGITGMLENALSSIGIDFSGYFKNMLGLLWTMVFGNTIQAAQAGFSDMVVITSAVMQKLVLVVVGLVFDYLICMTIFKDISGFLGGEKRLFGIEKIKVV